MVSATNSIPPVMGPDALDNNTYLHWVVDGEGGASVSCRVVGNSTFTFAGKLSLAGKALEISNGTLGADQRGTATITVLDSANLAGALSSPPAGCTVNAAFGGDDAYQVKRGSMWASFTCPVVEASPSDYCAASGIFVLENCAQE